MFEFTKRERMRERGERGQKRERDGERKNRSGRGLKGQHSVRQYENEKDINSAIQTDIQ